MCMDSFPKVREILLDEEICEQNFIDVITSIYKEECYIYAIVRKYEDELFNKLSIDFIIANKIPFPLAQFFPRTIGFLGHVKDEKKQYIFDFYLRASTLDFLVFSETDVSQLLNSINKKNIDIYKIFQLNLIPHITIGPDGGWLNVIEY